MPPKGRKKRKIKSSSSSSSRKSWTADERFKLPPPPLSGQSINPRRMNPLFQRELTGRAPASRKSSSSRESSVLTQYSGSSGDGQDGGVGYYPLDEYDTQMWLRGPDQERMYDKLRPRTRRQMTRVVDDRVHGKHYSVYGFPRGTPHPRGNYEAQWVQPGNPNPQAGWGGEGDEKLHTDRVRTLVSRLLSDPALYEAQLDEMMNAQKRGKRRRRHSPPSYTSSDPTFLKHYYRRTSSSHSRGSFGPTPVNVF
jgi:hypothetical protein